MGRYFGCHVSAAGGFVNAVRNGVELGVNSVQIHPVAPQRWNSKPHPEGFEDEFMEELEGSGIDKVFFHAIYLINLANPDKQKFRLSKLSLVHHLDLNGRIGGDGVIVHVGSMKDQESDEEGYRQIAEGIDWILDEVDNDAELLLEVAAGSGKIIGARMEELADIYSRVSNQDKVAFALDTQHMWASGYDWQNDLPNIMEDIKKNFGLDKVKIVHLNDSMTDLGSRRDRHENLGEGKIGKEALLAFINHREMKKIPFVLETPALKSMETAKPEVDVLREWIDS